MRDLLGNGRYESSGPDHNDPYYEQIYGAHAENDDQLDDSELHDPWELWSDEAWREPPLRTSATRTPSPWISAIIFAIAFAMIAVGLANIPLPQASSCADMAARQARPASNEAEIVIINCTGSSYQLIQSGSAARVSATQWISARHVVDTNKRNRIYLIGPDRKAHRVKSFTAHPTHDLVIMNLDKGLPGAILTLTNVQVGDKAVAVGPSGRTEDLTFQSLGTDSDDQTQVLVFDGEAHPGFSGGPIVTPDGHLAGMTYAIEPEQKITLAVAPEQIRQLMTKSTS